MTNRAVDLLKKLIAVPSFSRQEEDTATLLFNHLSSLGLNPQRHRNNLWALHRNYDRDKPILLLNAHHDTVKPSSAYTNDPFSPIEINNRIYGLGSNDDGASLVSLIEVFKHFQNQDLPFNLMLAITAEEEVTGENGMRAMVELWKSKHLLPKWAIIGEPTDMNAAIGERGLVVLDCSAHAKGGHAARNEGENALYKAIDDIEILRNLQFPTDSKLLGPIKVTVTQIEAGRQHNVLPEVCKFVVDVRTTDALTNAETVDFIKSKISSEAIARSTRINASVISRNHPLVKSALKAGATTFISPTTSDQSVLPMVDTLKIGPGKSERSHSADEFIEISEISDGISKYIEIINNFAHETLE